MLIKMFKTRMTRAKRAGGKAEVVEYLPHKRRALSSNPSTGKKKIYRAQIRPRVFMLTKGFQVTVDQRLILE
jgi:hypothetical protein